jgi:hypothetical protein
MAENAENPILTQVQALISTLKTKAELDKVKTAVKTRHEQLKMMRVPLRFLTEEEKVALAKGNSDEVIRVNKEKYDYSGIKEDDRRSLAEKWFKATKPSAGNAYYHWRVWNVPYGKYGKKNEKYKGDLIIEKATGRSVSPPPWEGDEEEEDEEVREEDLTVAMAAVRVE